MNWPQDTVGWLGPLPNPISWLDMYHHCNDDDIDYNYYHNRDEIHNNYDDTRSQEARWAPTFSISNPPTPNCSAGQWSSIDIESVCVCVCHRHSASVTNFNQNISISFSSKARPKQDPPGIPGLVKNWVESWNLVEIPSCPSPCRQPLQQSCQPPCPPSCWPSSEIWSEL